MNEETKQTLKDLYGELTSYLEYINSRMEENENGEKKEWVTKYYTELKQRQMNYLDVLKTIINM